MKDGPVASDPAGGFLTYYSNEPKAEVDIKAHFSEGSNEAQLHLSIRKVQNPEKFRWMLVGVGDNSFEVQSLEPEIAWSPPLRGLT